MNISNQSNYTDSNNSNGGTFISQSNSRRIQETDAQQQQRQGSLSSSLSSLQNQAQEWWITGFLNLTWVASHFLIGCTKFLTRWSVYLVTLVLLRFPRLLFVTSNKLHLTISFSTFIILATLTAYITYCIMKGNVFGQYKRLIPDDLNDEPISDIMESKNGRLNNKKLSSKKKHVTTAENDANRNLDGSNFNNSYTDDYGYTTSYLDQFLSAIKIFGYLEKPVFHDLTKNMKTQKLDEGEILLLDNSIGFSIVVEGTLQLYHKVEQDRDEIADAINKGFAKGMDDLNGNQFEQRSSITNLVPEFEDYTDDSETDDNDSTTYIRLKNGLGKFQLLNTVKPGNPVSSLVNILNLFTSYKNESDWSDVATSSPSLDSSRFQFLNTDRENLAKRPSTSSSTSISSPQTQNELPNLSDLLKPPSDNGDLPPGVMPKVIARAATDCTIAIIPPQAFAKLTAKYPHSASHIIQVILTRLYRVTFQTANDYLGLTREIMSMEVLLNKTVSYDLPFYLKEAVVRKLDSNKEKNDSETKNFMNSDNREKKPNNLDSRNSVKKPIERPNLAHLKAHGSLTGSTNSLRGSRHVVLESRGHLNPGDLLSSVPLSRKEFANPGSGPSQKKLITIGSSTVSSIPSPSSQQLPLSATSSKSFNNSTQNPTDSSILLQESNDLTRHNPVIPLAGFHSLKEDDIKTRLFSAAEEETEESAVRMALIEAMFTYLGISKENMAMPSAASSTPSQNDLSRRNSTLPNISSDFSLPSYFAGSPPSTMLRILPSDYAITSHRQKRTEKKAIYKEEVSPNLDFESAKNEFAQGIQLQYFKQGATIVNQNSKGKGLFYVVSGKIDVTTHSQQSPNDIHIKHSKDSANIPEITENVLFTVGAGGVAGYLSSLIGYKSFVNLKARTDVYVGLLPNQVLERLCDKYFMIYLRIAETLTSLLPPKMLKFDHALEWIQLSASDTLFNQGDPANGIYVVLNGRLRQFQYSQDDKKWDDASNSEEKDEGRNHLEVLGELAQGESFGEVEVLTAMNRIGTIVAVRDSELARIPRTLFELLALEHPSIMIRVSRLVAKKVIGNNNGQSGSSSKLSSRTGAKYDFNAISPPLKPFKANYNKKQHVHSSSSGTITYRTITILPITAGLPVEDFALKLVQAFKHVDRTTIGLNQRTALSHLGRHAFDRLAKLKKSGYFAELEEMYQTVVYIADTPINSSWTKTCIAQGDCILLLADASALPDIGEYEKLLLKSRTTARTELILLHPERYVEPGLTHKWLRHRSWIHSQHHIQFAVNPLGADTDGKHDGLNSGAFGLMDKLIQTEFSKRTQQNISKLVPESIKARVENFSSRFMNRKRQYYTPVHSHKNDFLRLARILSGQAIGLVLGGGGARGISHLGVLQAIEEQGIPIDMIGGTSIGSFIGGLYAKDYDLVPIYGRVKKFSGRIASIWRMMTDLTWPVTSYTTGHEFNRGIWKTFGDVRIEDFWIQYYCNSTNITQSVQEIHSSGYAWRYIRASMSLAGLLPPLEDQGSMLLDGGYLDNLPVWEMKARGCDTIFAVDVGSVDDRTPMNYGDSLNGFWIILNRWNPFSSHPNIPNMAEIQMRLGYVASVNALEKAKRTPGVIYARPPIEDYATLDFSKFEEIYEVGAKYGRIFLSELTKKGRMPYIPGSLSNSVEDKVPEFLSHRRNSI